MNINRVTEEEATMRRRNSLKNEKLKGKKNNLVQEEISEQMLNVLSLEKNKLTNLDINTIYQYLENILAQIPASVYWMNKNFIYLGCTNSMAQLLQLESRHSIVGKTYADLYDEKTSAYYKKTDKTVMENGTPISLEEPLYFFDGSKKIYLSKKVPLRDLQGNIIGMLGISVDITDRKKMEKDLKIAKEASEKANRAKSAFIANMSHDIRTPLTGIIGLSGILEDEVTEPEQKETAHMLNISGEQLLSLLNSVLDIVASDSMQEKKVIPSAFDLEDLLHNIFELELPALQIKSIALKLHMDEAIPKIIESDKGKIYRILLNLISNAIKFTIEGSITLSVKALKQKEDKTLLQFKVQDTGIGIDEKDKDRIFDRFFRAIPSYEGKFDGHGVGLAIVKQYIEALKGNVSVDSQLNQGTTVSVTIPVKVLSQETIQTNNLEKELCQHQPKQSSETSTPTSEIQENSEDKKPFVLLVEDNPMAMKIASLMLSKANCHHLQAVNGTEALELVKNNRFDWIISDIGLPDFSGFALAKKIADYEKEQGLPLTPIIGLTAHAKEEALKHSEASGMKTVLEKPLKPEAVQALIQEYFSADKFSTEKHENSTTQPGSVQNLPLFEFDKAVKQVGNKETVIELIEYMLNEELTTSLKNIDTAYQKKDWEQFKALVHKFKSSCLYCATTALLDLTQQLEKTALLDDHQQKEALYQTFQQSCEKTKAHLTQWLWENQS